MTDGTGTHDVPGSVAGRNGLAAETSRQPANSGSEDNKVEEQGNTSHWRRRVVVAGVLAVIVASGVVLPPFINISRYQHQVATLMSRSLGRPVHMSNVNLRLLPRPGFVLNDLSVGEDPGFGVEPILSARTVVASIRLLSLWRGKVEIDRVSVDDASLNLVRSAQGRWNLDSLMISAQPALTGRDANAGPGKSSSGVSRHFPYLEATNSRVNLKNGVEKSPFSLVETDLSLWQDEPGRWRVRLRGQPVRTDLDMSLADTGELRMEASMRSAATLREMPLQMQMEWRDAQLGQLSRMLFGSDAGWRGAVTADIEVQGTPDAAQTKARLRATGVRREEFAPDTPLDFDANCTFRYEHSQEAVHDIGCDTAIGNGKLHLQGDLPGNSQAPEVMLQAKDIPLQAGLDLLRTVRSGFAPGISIKGTVNGTLLYKQVVAKTNSQEKKSTQKSLGKKAQQGAPATDPRLANFTGSLTVDGGQIKGGELKEPLQLPRVTLTPALVAVAPQSQARGVSNGHTAAIPSVPDRDASSPGLGTRFTILLGQVASAQSGGRAGGEAAQGAGVQTDASAAQPVKDPTKDSTKDLAKDTINVRLALGLARYNAAVVGTANTAKLRELAYAFGLPHLDAANSFVGGTADFDLSAAGPWIAPDEAPIADPGAAPANVADSASSKKVRAVKAASISNETLAPAPGQQALFGTLQLRHAQWKPSFLALPVDLSSATVTVADTRITWTSDFSFGTVKGGDKDAKPASNVESNRGASKEPDQGAKKDFDKDADKARGEAPDKAPGRDQTKGPELVSQPGSQAGVEGDKAPSTKSPKSDSIQGSVVVTASTDCKTADCVPVVQLHFDTVDAAQAEAALLGSPQQKSLLSPLIDRMRSTDRPKWPDAAVIAQADSLTLGPATLQKVTVRMRFKGSEIALQDWEAGLLDGSAKGTGNFSWTGNKPDYSLDGNFTRVNPSALGALLNSPLSGGLLNGSGSVHLIGLSAKELGDSASGQLKFDWTKGTLATASQEVHFDDWSGTVAIQGGMAQVGQNAMLASRHSSVVAGTIPFNGPAKFSVTPADAKLVAHAAKPAAQPAVK
jgi:uncharacterized protein involved in outer membrane biogenesis